MLGLFLRNTPLFKGIVVVFLIFIVYFALITLTNSLLNSNKNEIRNFMSNFGVSFDFSEIRLSYDLNLYVSDLKISMSNFGFYSEKTYFGLDIRKALLGKLPVSKMSIFNSGISIYSEFTNKESPEGDYEKLLSDVLDRIGNLSVESKNLKLAYIGSDFSGDLLLKQFSAKVINGESVLFDLFSELDVSLGKSITFAKTELSTTGILTLKDGKISTLSGKVSLGNSELLRVKLKDINFNFFFSKGQLVGTGFSEHYNIDFELSRNGVKLNAEVLNFIDKGDFFTNYEADISLYKNTEVEAILDDLLRYFSLQIVVSNNGAIDLGLKSSNTYLEYHKVNDGDKLSFLYTNSDRYIKVQKVNNFLIASGHKVNVFGNVVNLYVSTVLSSNNIKFNSTELYINGVPVNFIDNLNVSNNLLVVNNNYIKGSVNLSDLTGTLELRDNLLSSLLEVLKINFPFHLDGYAAIKMERGKVMTGLNFSLLDGYILIKSNEVELQNVRVIPYGITINGKGFKTNDNFKFNSLVKLKDEVIPHEVIPREVIPLSIDLFKNNLRIVGKDNIFIDGDISKGIFNVGIYNISLGGFEIKAINFRTSLNEKQINGKADISFSNFRLKGDLKGNLDDINIDGYLYSQSRTLEVVGEIFPKGKELAKFKIDDSTIAFSTENGGILSVDVDLKKLYLPNAFNLPVTKLSGNAVLRIDLSETNIFKSIVYAKGYIVSYLNGLFYKSDVSFYVDKDKVNISGNLYNYFNVVSMELDLPKEYGDVYFETQVLPRIKSRKQAPNYIRFNGNLNDGRLNGKLITRINDFSGLREIWDRSLEWSSEGIKLIGDGDGLNILYSNDKLSLSYIRENKLLYTMDGSRDNSSGNFVVKVNGTMPLEFLIIPDFITSIKDLKLTTSDLSVIITKKGDIELVGNSKVSGNSVKLSLVKDELRNISGNIVMNKSRIGFDNVLSKSGNGIVYVLGGIDIDNISNPFLDLIITNKGTIRAILDISGLKVEGDANVGMKLSGFVDNPYLSGVVNFFENSKVYYFLSSYSPPVVEDESITPNFAQILNFSSLILKFDRDLYFKSEIIEGYTKSLSTIQINGSVFKNTLSLSGDVLLEDGTLNYLGRIFNINQVKLVFSGKEMYFVPYVIGEFYKYSFDSSRNEQVKIIMKTSGNAMKLNPVFSSEPELSMSEISRILGLSISSTNIAKESLELIESIGIYDFVSYIMKSYTGLDVFYIKSPFVSSYLLSVIDRNYTLSYIDMIKGTEIEIGKNILPWFLVGYKLGFEYVGNDKSTENDFVPLHSFSLGWTYRNLLLELEYSSFISKTKNVEYEPRLDVKFNKRF
jgi:hypothetical protein